MNEPLVWMRRKPTDFDQTAWLEGAPEPGHVMGAIFNPIGDGGYWRYWVGCSAADQSLSASMEEMGWIAESEAEAKDLCAQEMLRLRRWANGQGPETIPELIWLHDGNSRQGAEYKRVRLSLAPSGEGWKLGLDATIGEPEEKGYLRAIPVALDDGMGLGSFDFPTEAAAKAWAQEQAAALCRWLGGDPDRVVDPAQEVLALA